MGLTDLVALLSSDAAIQIIASIVKILIIVVLCLQIPPVMVWAERRAPAMMQRRKGPNRVGIGKFRLYGLLQSAADAVKLIFKEEVVPTGANKVVYHIAPIFSVFTAFLVACAIPYGNDITVFGQQISLSPIRLDVGFLFILAMSSLAVYGVTLAGWASNNKYSLLGSLRASAQMISYEVALGLSVVAIFLLSGSLKLQDIVANQGALVWNWNVIRQPLAFVLFLVALFAETNRLPFDLPEGESEIVAGYHTEYSSMRFALFFMGEYAHIVVGSLIIATLFFGGWQFPFVDTSIIRTYADDIVRFGWPTGAILLFFFGWWLTSKFKRRYHDLRDYEPLVWGVPALIFAVILLVAWSGLFSGGYLNNLPEWLGPLVVFAIQLATLLLKALFFCAFFIWVRWTLPRFRYDQLMHLGWKVMVPLGVANIIITSAVLVFY